MAIGVAFIGIVWLDGCSTVTGGTKQVVAISTPGATAASCRLTDGKKLNKTVAAPGSVVLHKGHAPITVACNAEGQQTASRTFRPHFSRASAVQVPGGYALDAISGAMWTYPTAFEVPFGNATPAAASPPAKR